VTVSVGKMRLPSPDTLVAEVSKAERSAVKDRESTADGASQGDAGAAPAGAALREQHAGETGGPKGPEPTRYGDWEKGGRCFDF
jgi:hypothetical protein